MEIYKINQANQSKIIELMTIKFVELKLIIISADLIKVKLLIIVILKVIIRLERVQIL